MHSWPILAQLLPDIHLRLHFGHLYSPKHRFLPWYGVSPSPLGRACRNYVRFQFPIRIGVVAAVVVVAVGAVAAAAAVADAVADVVAVVVAADAVVVAPLTAWAQNAIRLNNCMRSLRVRVHVRAYCCCLDSLASRRSLSGHSLSPPRQGALFLLSAFFSCQHNSNPLLLAGTFYEEGGVFTRSENVIVKITGTVEKFCARSSNFSIKI